MTAPVALFVYNRADNTRKTLEALMANTLSPQTDLYVFSDGGRDENSWRAVRDVRNLLHKVETSVARTHAFKSMTVVKRTTNFYLERNVIEGINEVLADHDTIIVLEDDIVTAPHFLQFMNDAFTLYKDEKRVMHVSGFTRLSPNPSLIREGSGYHEDGYRQTYSNDYAAWLTHSHTHTTSQPNTHSHIHTDAQPTTHSHNHTDALFPTTTQVHFTPLPQEGGDGGESYFTPFMAGWGWGTWRDRWQQHFRHYQSRGEALEGLGTEDLEALEYGGVFPCLTNLNRKPIPWDICWGIAIHRAHGLCLYPTRTLVRNIGLDSGTHYGHMPRWCVRLLQRYEYDREPHNGPIALTYCHPEVNPAIEAEMQKALTDWGIRYTWLGQILRSVYKAMQRLQRP